MKVEHYTVNSLFKQIDCKHFKFSCSHFEIDRVLHKKSEKYFVCLLYFEQAILTKLVLVNETTTRSVSIS